MADKTVEVQDGIEIRAAHVRSRGLQELVDYLRPKSFAHCHGGRFQVVGNELIIDLMFNLKGEGSHVAFPVSVIIPLDGVQLDRELEPKQSVEEEVMHVPV